MASPPAAKTAKSTPKAKPTAPKEAVRPAPESLNLVVYPHPALKKHAAEVTQFDAWLPAVAVRMKQVMIENKGVGLAAPQVGVGLRMFVWSPEGQLDETQVYVNPVFSQLEGEEEGEEGCLSLPEIRTKVVRYTKLHVEALDQFGHPIAADLEGFPARIVQHENDHLEGILLLDRMGPVAKLANRKKIKELEKQAGE
ncbi:MAG: peptide deformylase [Phycisphaerae bacterium]